MRQDWWPGYGSSLRSLCHAARNDCRKHIHLLSVWLDDKILFESLDQAGSYPGCGEMTRSLRRHFHSTQKKHPKENRGLQEVGQEKPTVEVYNKYSFAILFNLALAHHLAGMECPESRKGKLRKALRLYEFAYSIQVQEDIQLQIKYTLGMVNNLGHIQELLGDHQKAHQCFQHLLSTLMYVLEGGEANEDGKWDIFLHNVSHLILRESALAAAA